jgi:hypothetical protein
MQKQREQQNFNMTCQFCNRGSVEVVVTFGNHEYITCAEAAHECMWL